MFNVEEGAVFVLVAVGVVVFVSVAFFVFRRCILCSLHPVLVGLWYSTVLLLGVP